MQSAEGQEDIINVQKFLTKCQKMGESGEKWEFLYYFYTLTGKCRNDNIYRGIYMQGGCEREDHAAFSIQEAIARNCTGEIRG